MSLRDVMEFVQKQQCKGTFVTPVTPANSTGLQLEPAWIGRVPPVTPVTPHLYEVGCTEPIERTDAAANNRTIPAPSQHHADTVPAPEHPAAVAWQALDKAYQAHHVKCPICIAAGRGIRYGLRCGTGAALWTAYSEAGQQPGALPWQQHAVRRRSH